jgi:preprotein translocase subunit SecD
MKTFYYFLFSSFICITLGFSISETSKNVILSAADSNVSNDLLTQSSRIISNRLKTYNLETSVSVISDKSQIKVQIPEDMNVSEIEGLLTSKGNPGFYETLTVKEIADLSNNDLNNKPSESRLACSSIENKHVSDSVESVLKSVKLSADYKLFWGLKNSKSLTCLYAVRTKPALTKADIGSITSIKNSQTRSITIEIKFNQPSAEIWAATTKKCLNKPIVIVIDDKVFYTPVVKTPIENGLCEITGNFSQKEVDYFLALVTNDTLPVNLIIK